MHRVKLDRASPAVKQFIRSLPIKTGNVELELNGKILCKVLGPHQLLAAEQEALIKRGRKLLEQSHARNRGLSAREVERIVNRAVQQVRRRKKQ